MNYGSVVVALLFSVVFFVFICLFCFLPTVVDSPQSKKKASEQGKEFFIQVMNIPGVLLVP